MTVVIGLTGSFGSGKSTVAAMLAEMGAPVLDADQVAREVVQPSQPAFREIVEAFGERMVADDGTLDRKKLAQWVFTDAGARATLNRIVHPRVREATGRFVEAHPEAPVVVLEIPLLLENDARQRVDKVAVVSTNERNRFGRLKAKGFSEKQIIERLGSQMSQARKIALADEVIRNEGDLKTTRERVRRLALKYGLLSRHASRNP